MSLISFLEGLLPFLVSAARKTFDKLEDSVKEAGINGSLFAQIIKENVDAAEADVNALLKEKLKLDDQQLQTLLAEIRVKYNVPTALSVTKFLQAKFYDVTDDILHNSLANEVAAVAAIILSKGKLSWLTLLMGVGEYIYRKFVKSTPVNIMTTPCPDPKPSGGGSTPFGQWECKSGSWVWVPELG